MMSCDVMYADHGMSCDVMGAAHVMSYRYDTLHYVTTAEEKLDFLC